MNKLLFLGTGGAEGVPVVFCECEVCKTYLNMGKTRLRSSVYINTDQGERILIDVGPDFRLQMLKYNIKDIDAVFLTHLHYDHAGGLDELRAYNFLKKKDVPVFLSHANYLELKKIKPYFFKQQLEKESVKASFQFFPFENFFGIISFKSLSIEYITYKQGITKVNGFLFGKLAYVTDIKTFSAEVKEKLYNLDCLIISVSNYNSHPYAMHLSIKEIIDLVQEIQPRRTVLSHIGHMLYIDDIKSELPENIEFAFDGMEINF